MQTREEMRSLAEEIVGSYADRVAGIAQLRETVKLDLKGFHDSRTAMAKELRADLSKVRPALAEDDRQRQSEAREFMGELARVIAEGKATVQTLLKELDNAHQAMSTQLRADLAKDEEERLRQARALKQELVRGIAELKSAVNAQLKEFADIQAGVRDEWQTLTATMQAKRVGLAVVVKPSEAVAPPPVEEVAAPPPVEEVAEEEAVARAGEAEVTPEIAKLGDRVFKYLANHPDGTKLIELEEEFGLARIQMARIVRNLMNENKVEKRELLYFAI